MDELTIEQKAKAYDEVVNKLKGFMAQGVNPLITRDDVQDFFPELKESEDERIRKELIAFLKENLETGRADETWSMSGLERWIAWLEKQGQTFTKKDVDYAYLKGVCDAKHELEKQGEQKPILNVEIPFGAKDSDLQEETYFIPKGFHAEIDGDKVHIKKGEQKPVDKVEPKFEIEKGKWYVCNTSRYADFVVGKAYYCPKNGMLKPNENEMARYVAKHYFRLWTIQDAKDGDVLAADNYIILFKKLLPQNGGVSCCHYDYACSDPYFNFNEDNNWYFGKESKIHPATKEQRDLLFTKMKEAGYEWDAEKKELKKIEQNPAWSEEDDEMVQVAINACNSYQDSLVRNDSRFDKAVKAEDWLKDLKSRVQPQTTWKPSEEQMNVLDVAIKNSHLTTAEYDGLVKLREQLKKL